MMMPAFVTPEDSIVVPEKEPQCVQARSYLKLVFFNTSLLCTHSHVLCIGRKKDQQRQQHARALHTCASIYADDLFGRDAV